MDFQELLKRRTIRIFEQRPVPRDVVLRCVDAASLASSAANNQKLRYLAVDEPAKVAELLGLTAYAARVAPKRTPVAGISGPALFLVLYAQGPVSETLYADAGAAIQSLEFAAWNEGVGCCWIGSFRRRETAELLELPPDSLLYCVAMGYPAESPELDRIGVGDPPAYYLDERNVLHVPKYRGTEVLKFYGRN